MKAAFMQGPGQFVIREVPEPSPGEKEVTLQVRACAICGSDLTVYKMGIAERILGHEFCGDIIAVGAGVKGWKPGDRAVVEPTIVCGECHWCKQGRFNLCDSLGYTGLASDGGLAAVARAPAYQLHPLPEEISYEYGAMIEPLSVALRGVQLSGLKSGDSVVVMGCGAVGLFTLLWARYKGAGKTIAVDVVPARVSAAAGLADVTLNAAEVDAVGEILALTQELGPEVIFECSGNSGAQVQAVNAVRKGGRIILLGIGYEPVPLMLAQLTLKEICLKGSLAYSSLSGSGEFCEAIEAIRSGGINMDKIPVHTYSLEEVGRAFEAVAHGEVAKAIVHPL
jgi:threonine dehydrogenase-like Zn-dependent dehydrogenase